VGFLLPTLVVLILDQISKQFIWGLGANFNLIGDFFRITLVKNSGAAFGMFQSGRVFLVISSVVASVFIIFLAQRLGEAEKAKRLFLGMILGGALGNLVDRIYPGQVIDFLDMGFGTHRWPVYNIADSAVTIGGILLILSFTRSRDTQAE
jgi:signal peptidase II